MAFNAVTRSSGTVADARNASCAEIFPAESAPAKISDRIADSARTLDALRSAMLAVVATICRPSEVCPAEISPSDTVTGCVWIVPSACTVTA